MKDELTSHIVQRISTRIRQERQLKELSQEGVVEILDDDVSVSTLSRYENCSGTMTVQTLAKIAQALDIAVPDLLGETENYTESREAAKFIFYYPLIPREVIGDVIWRIGGVFYGREGYINQLIDHVIKEIPESPAKKWADFNVNFRPIASKFQHTWGCEEGIKLIRKHPDIMALFGDDLPDDCYAAYYDVIRKQHDQ